MPTAAEWLPLGTAFVLGLLHALEVDHMVAVTAFVAKQPTLRAASAFGLRWGLGHSLTVFVVGTILLASGLRWSDRYEAWGEAMVGAMLIGVGVWAIRASRRLHLHPPEEHGNHAHLHSHSPAGALHHHAHPPRVQGHRHEHRHGITLVGIVHGLAGTSAVVALVPVTLVARVSVGVAYLIAFGMGTVMAMTVFAAVVASAMRSAAGRSVALGQRLSAAIGGAGIVVGGWWLLKAIRGG